MADAAWAELQAGESGARDKAWDRILKKNAVAKKAKKKRPPKGWEPPVVAPPRKKSRPKPPAPPETAVALLRRLARAVQQTAAEDSKVSGRGPRHARQSLNAEPARRDGCRITAFILPALVEALRGSRRKITGEGHHADGGILSKGQRICSRISHTCSLSYTIAALQLLDWTSKTLVFVFDCNDEFKRGKATARPDLQEAFARTRLVNSESPPRSCAYSYANCSLW